MRILVESLKRLFFYGKVSKERLDELVTDGKITAEENDYIIKEETDTIIKVETGEGE